MSARRQARFAKPPVELAIVPAARAWQVGRPIAVRVAATGLQDGCIREARAELVMMLWLGERVMMAGPWGAVPPSGAPERVVTGTGSSLSLGGDLPAGTTAECEAELPNWAQAPTGGAFPGRRIEYRVRAEIVFADGRETRQDAPVRLVSPPSQYQEVEGITRRRQSRRCELELAVPAWRARPGETVRGTLRVVPRGGVRARALFIGLAMRQSVPLYFRYVQGQKLAANTVLTAPGEFPFEFTLPRTCCPTLITPQLWVRWYLSAGLRYGLLSTDRLERELNVYTGGR
jgi:hypothetical protein